MKSFILKIIPHLVLVEYGKYKQYRLKIKIIKYLSTSSEFEEIEKDKIMNYLKNNSFSIFPYDFIKKYNPRDIMVYTDNIYGMKYVIHENKRLYFKKAWNKKRIRDYYATLLLEQDIDSPHRYETKNFHVNDGDVVVDIGIAEGNFALSVVDKAKKLYLFEVDKEWIEALKITFAPWKEKVVIVNKYVSNIDDENCITLDTFFGKEEIDFIKADIEGAEIELLKGSQALLSNNKKLKIVMCTYHNQNDAEKIRQILDKSAFSTEFSKGYMIFIYEKMFDKPYLRKGLIRGIKR